MMVIKNGAYLSLGAYARTKEGEVWVCQCREDMSRDESDTDNQDKEMLVVIFATAGNLTLLG